MWHTTLIPAHVVGSDHLTQLVVNWTIGLTVPIALAAGLVLRRRQVRQVPLLVAATAAVTLAVSVLFPLFPSGPALRLWFADPHGDAHVARDVQLEVCATARDGAPTPPLGGGNLLAVYLDGSQVSTMSSPRFLLEVAAGRHEVRVELVDAQHRAFDPDISAQVQLTAGSIGAVTASPGCPG
jgi:hypothetical protein